MKRQKVAVIVWTVDPEGNKRFLLRHNKPFDGYGDEWTVTFGGIEDSELLKVGMTNSLQTLMNNQSMLTQDFQYYKKRRITTLSRLITS